VRGGLLLRTVLPAVVCLGVILCFYGYVSARGFSGVPPGLEALVTPASAVLAVVAYLDLRGRGVETRGALALLTFILPPVGVWLWVSRARRLRPPPPGAPAGASAPERAVPVRRVSRRSAGRARRRRRRG
jgi:hypothetical protein